MKVNKGTSKQITKLYTNRNTHIKAVHRNSSDEYNRNQCLEQNSITFRFIKTKTKTPIHCMCSNEFKVVTKR